MNEYLIHFWMYCEFNMLNSSSPSSSTQSLHVTNHRAPHKPRGSLCGSSIVLCCSERSVLVVSVRSAAGSRPIFTEVLLQQAAALKTSPLCIDLTPETHCRQETDCRLVYSSSSSVWTFIDWLIGPLISSPQSVTVVQYRNCRSRMHLA